MFKINFQGKEYDCLEHMKEIKLVADKQLFGRFFNKKQMFNFFLGHSRRNDEGEITDEKMDPEDDGYHGICYGRYVYTGRYDALVEFYKIGELKPDMYVNIFDSFFVKDDAGQIWYVNVNVD